MLISSFYHLFKVKAYNLDTVLNVFSFGLAEEKGRKRKGTKLNVTGRTSRKYTKLINSLKNNIGKWPSYLTLQNSWLAFTSLSTTNAMNVSQKLRVLSFKRMSFAKVIQKRKLPKSLWEASNPALTNIPWFQF